jgi:pSer/pThr/pTyr-binding forkhead associated (FHA) protein
MATLIDPKTGESRKLVKAVTLIGRADYCDVCLPSPIVSREHARITRKLTGATLEDLGSTYGTRLNDVRIRRRAKLRDGDIITIGVARDETVPRPPDTDTPIGPLFEAAAREPSVGGTFLFRK